MSSNPMKDNVFRRLDELRRAISGDRFDLNRDDQYFLEMKLDEFKKLLDEKYDK